MSDSLAPAFLIAVPQLQDPNFRQSVVFLLEQAEEGAMGVIINQDSSIEVADLCRDHDLPYGGYPGRRVRCGGPVRPEQGLVLYGPEHSDPEGRRVADGLFVSASRNTLRTLCQRPTGRFQCYSGYAGWGPGQLEREIRDGSWVVADPDAAMLLDEAPDRIWAGSLHAMGIDPATMVLGGAAEA